MLQPEELLLLPRKELQLLAKSHGLKANASNSLLIEQLLNINNNFQENNGGNESMRSSTSTTDTANNQFPGLIKSVKAELECKLLIESNKVPLRKSLSAQSNDQQASAQVSSPPSSQEKDVGQWAVSMQKCIGELVKSDSFISCASKLNSASKQTLKRISPIRTVTSSSIQVLSGKKRSVSEIEPSTSDCCRPISPTKVPQILPSMSPTKKAPDFAKLHTLQFSASRSITDCVRKQHVKSSPAVVKSNQPATVQVSKKPKVQPTKAVLASLTTSSTQQPALPSRTAIAPSPMKSVEKVAMKSKSNLRTPHNSNTGRNPLSNQPHSLTQNPRTDHTSTSIVVLGGQFKARPMPNFKAIHGSKPTVLPRTVHTPTAAPITTTVPVASANIRPNTNTKPISTSKPLQTVSSHRMFSSSANKENKEKPAGNNIPSGPSRPVTVRKGLDHDRQRMIRQETHQIHSRNETAKSLAIARGLPSSMKRLVPTVTAPTVNKVSGSINAFDGFSGDNDGEF